jgi:hypothetical protein
LKTFRSEVARGIARTTLGALAISALLVGSNARTAAAQTTSDDTPQDPNVAEARAAFREATSLARQAQWGEALLAFERSSRLRPHTFTTYNIGYCERALGRYTRARKFLAKALAENEAHGGNALATDVIADAKKYLVEIDQRLARATVTLSPADAAIAVDGRPLEVVAADRSPPVFAAGTRDLAPGEVPAVTRFELLLDPGAHAFTVSKPGSPDLLVSHTFQAGAREPIDLKLTVAPAAPARPDNPPAGAEVARESKPNRTPGYIFLTVGAVGLATGSVAGILALQQKHKLDQSCHNATCGLDLQSTHDSMNRFADVSTVAFALGGVSIAVSTYLLLSEGSARPRPPSSASTAPSTNTRALGYTGVVIRPEIGFGSAFVSGSF